jgi:HEAT repeat protein
MKRLTYQEPYPITREEADSAFASGDPEQIADTLVNAAFHDPDWQWVQAKCLGFARSNAAAVRYIAATCLGHVARIHRQLDLDKVAPVLKELLNDPEIYVRGSAEDAIEDIKIFMHVDIQDK